MLSVHATDGVQVLLAGLLDKSSKAFPKQQAEISGNGRQTPRPGEPKGLGLWPCYTGESMADEGVDIGHDPTSESTFEGAPSASALHASPSPRTTTLPTPDPAAATSTPITTPPMAEDTGFTGMPTYPAYGVDPSTTAVLEATTASEPVASSSAPRWYAADYHHPLPATGAYVDVPGYATLSGLRRGPESRGSRSRGSGRSSNRSLTRAESKEALRGATSELVGDLTQEIRAKLDPLIPPQASPTIVGVSPHRVQANHLVAGLTNTLGSLGTRPMPTPAVIPRSPFIPRTAQPPYSHVENFTRAELDRLGLTALRAMVDVEPYGSSDLGGDPFDDEYRRVSSRVARSQQMKKNKEKDAQPEKISRKIDFSDLKNPQKNFTPLFGEVAKFSTLTENKRTTESQRRRS